MRIFLNFFPFLNYFWNLKEPFHYDKMDLLIQEIKLYTNLDYHIEYLHLIHRICVWKSCTSLAQIQLIISISLYVFGHCVYLYFIGSNRFTHLDRLVHFDLFYLILPKSTVNVMCAFQSLLTGRFFTIFYLKQNVEIVDFYLRNMLDGFGEDCYIYQRKSRKIKRKLRKLTVLVCNLLRPLFWICLVFSIYSFVMMEMKLLEFFDVLDYSQLLFHYFNAFTLYHTFLHFTQVGLLMASVGSTLITVFKIQFQQCHTFVESLYRRKKSVERFHKFHFYFLKSLHLFLKLSLRQFRLIFLSFSIINLPINSSIVIWIALKQLDDPLHRLFALSLVFGQIGCIFGIHLVAAYFVTYIHRPVGMIVRLYTSDGHRIRVLQTRIRIAGYICAFHTRNKYGFTYMAFGLITLNTFAKVSRKNNRKKTN